MRRNTAWLLCGALLAGPVLADPSQDLQNHQHAEALARAAQRADAGRAALLAEQQVAAAAALRRLERQTSDDMQELARLQAQQAAAGQRLAVAQSGLATLLPVMQRLAAQPEATLLASPQPPADAVRGIAILQGIAQSIAAQAQTVQQEAAQNRALLAQAQAMQTQLNQAAAAQQQAETALTAQINAAQADEMTQADTAAREAAASLAARHRLDSLNDMVASLVPMGLPQNLPKGSGGAPVAGRVVQSYGASTLAGPATGVSYGAAPGARVATPCAGTVMFADAFPAYGHMVIVDCGGGASVVLAGMDRLDVAAGERLAHGQPVGAMLGYDEAMPTRQPILYVELRQNGAPVNPSAWLMGGGSG